MHAATNVSAVACYVSALVVRARGGSGAVLTMVGRAAAGIGAVLGGHLSFRQALGANHAEDVTDIGPTTWQRWVRSPSSPTASRSGGSPEPFRCSSCVEVAPPR